MVSSRESAGRGEGVVSDAITEGFGDHFDPIVRSLPDQLSYARTYWLNHSMVRDQACGAVTLL